MAITLEQYSAIQERLKTASTRQIPLPVIYQLNILITLIVREQDATLNQLMINFVEEMSLLITQIDHPKVIKGAPPIGLLIQQYKRVIDAIYARKAESDPDAINNLSHLLAQQVKQLNDDAKVVEKTFHRYALIRKIAAVAVVLLAIAAGVLGLALMVALPHLAVTALIGPGVATSPILLKAVIYFNLSIVGLFSALPGAILGFFTAAPLGIMAGYLLEGLRVKTGQQPVRDLTKHLKPAPKSRSLFNFFKKTVASLAPDINVTEVSVAKPDFAV